MPAYTYDKSVNDQSDAPATNAFAITPDDVDELEFVTRGIYVGGTGDIALTTVDGEDVTFTALQVGTILPIRARKVLSTGTTATNLVALI